MKISREILLKRAGAKIFILKEYYRSGSFYYMNCEIENDTDLDDILGILLNYLKTNDLTVLHTYCYGSVGNVVYDSYYDDLKPLVSLYHELSQGCKMQIFCTDLMVSYLMQPDKSSCLSVRHQGAELSLINISAGKNSDCNNEYTRQFRILSDIMKNNAIAFSGLARTWLYIRDILKWYNDLNTARDNFFTKENIWSGLIPASTGIGLNNNLDKCLSLTAFAIKPINDNVRIRKVDSPMQCEATDYRSSFSRAVEIEFDSSRRLFISGTASIDSMGNTIHRDDVRKQIAHTMRVVEEILSAEEYSWENMVRAIAYFP